MGKNRAMRTLLARLFRALGQPVLLSIACLALAATSALSDSERTVRISKGPYIQADGPDTMTVMWESPTNNPGTVFYGLTPQLDHELRNVRPFPMTGISTVSRTNVQTVLKTNLLSTDRVRVVPVLKTNFTAISVTNQFFVYEATLRNLRPGIRYSYRVGLDGARTRARQFKTLSLDAAKVRFIAYGDSRSNPSTHRALTRQFRALSPDFILHTGDLVARGKDYSLWSKEFFTPLTGVIDEVPLFSVLGNHEQDGTNYLAYFHLPGNELWYSLDDGPAHVLALDFRSEKASEEQFRFARNDLLKSRAPWKIVMLHYPVFNIGGHATGWGHAAYLPLFHEAKVDMVLAGHSHIYERFRPIAPDGEPGAWAITYVTTGGGGAPLYASLSPPALAARSPTNHFVVFEATREKLIAKTIQLNGGVIDRFELSKTNGRQPASYLAEVYPEQSLKLFFEIAPSLAGRVAALPKTNSPANVMLTLVPRKAPLQPAEMEITLASASAPFYELSGGLVHAMTPPAGVTNRVVWLKVRATGKKKISENSDQVLSPPLVFQARVQAGDHSTVAYGARSRRSQIAADAADKLDSGLDSDPE